MALHEDCPARRKFLTRLHNEIGKHGTIHVLRNGVKHGQHRLELFYHTPTPGNARAAALFEQNRFTVVRQLKYNPRGTRHALDLGLFINGLPVFTMELKNNLTKQTVQDAIRQYREHRNPREQLFALGRCIAHFAVDESEVWFCTHLAGKASWFLPFNKGWNGGAGNPPNPDGIKTDYLWGEVLTRESLADLIQNYAQVLTQQGPRSRKAADNGRRQIWPRYHQLDVVRKLLADAASKGVGQRYLIQHSAGSGKSNSIAWLAHQLIGLERQGRKVFDSVIVVTDRRILDQQICATIKAYAQINALVGHAENAGDLRRFLSDGKKLIISTLQKFPFILDEIDDEHRQHNFAIIIDEAHSSQGGKASTALGRALAGAGKAGATELNSAGSTGSTDRADNEDDAGGSGDPDEAEPDYEDQINRLIESRKMLPNASYFAFTATPKSKTLELFGTPNPQADGTVQHHAFHTYSMKQAIQECFILDVLQHYTPVSSYYKLIKTVADDPKFEVAKAQKKLRRFVEGHDHAIRLKAGIMVDHFHEQVLAGRKLGGQARAMVVTDGVARAIKYFYAIRKCLSERNSFYRPLVAFAGEHQYDGQTVTEAKLNGFPAKQIAEQFRTDPYRFLICADKFQTGYDEPLLHTMYVDKTLSGIKAVQTLSRLNRVHPNKREVFVLDFRNDADIIREAFEPYYRATILSDQTDPDRLHNLQAELDQAEVYAREQVSELVKLFLNGAPRDQLDPILNVCVANYLHQSMREDEQVRFKRNARAFIRTYEFLAMLLTYNSTEWEQLCIFLNLLLPRLPAPEEEDLSQGILATIDMESYQVEKQTQQTVKLANADGTIDPATEGRGGVREPELDLLSNIIAEFNARWGDAIAWEDKDQVLKHITEVIPHQVAEDPAYQNAMLNSDKANAKIQLEETLKTVMFGLMNDHATLFRKFSDDPDFKAFLSNAIFQQTYQQPASRVMSANHAGRG